MNRVVVALGSNIDKERNLSRAVDWLRQTVQVTAVSAIYETIPAGSCNQPNFWNRAVLIETSLTPSQLKQEVIGALESALKRVRQPDPNAPRTIDVDIVLFNDMVGAYDGGDGRWRRLPDPDLLKFAHVAVPVAELLPDMPHPVTGERLANLGQRLLAEATAQFGERPLWKV